MASSLYDRISSVRDRLRHPRANRPGDGDVLRSLCDHVKLLRAKRKHTGNPWDYSTKRIKVQPDKAKYQIGDARFGTPLAIVTVDDSNPQHFQQIIPWYSPQNLAFHWGLPNDIGTSMWTWDGSMHTAQRVAYYRSSGVPYLEFQPMPKSAADYLCLFVVGDSVDEMALSDPLAMGEVGDTLSEIRAAISMLPFADYFDDKDLNAERRKELGVTLDWEEKLFDKQYTDDVLIHTGSTMGQLWSPEEDY